MNKNNMRKLVTSAMFAALILVVTGFLPRIPVTAGLSGYVHFGDAVIYLAACVLPLPWGAAAAAVGASLADLLTGYAVWAPGTLVIKAAMALAFTPRGKKLLCGRNAVASVIAGVVCVGGYYLYEAALTASFAVPLASLPGNLTQAVGSAVIYFAVAFMLDRVNIKAKLEAGFSDDRFR